MGYSEKNIRSLTKRLNEIQGRKEHAQAATTYRDVPALQEMEEIVKEELAEDNDKDTLIDSIAVLGFLAEAYDGMGRSVISARIYNQILALAVTLKQTYQEDVADIGDLFYTALRVRNLYVDDDCEDLAAMALCLMPKSKVESMVAERKARRRTLRRDPVEMSEEYLAVIDKVEEKVEKNRKTRGHGSCYEVWQLERQYLAEYGIEWRSPARLNPTFHFD